MKESFDVQNKEGVVTSLADIRFASLRAQHNSLVERMSSMVETAHQNAQRFQFITELSLALIECENLRQIDAVIQHHVIDQTEASDTIFFVRGKRTSDCSDDLAHVKFMAEHNDNALTRLFNASNSFCETCRSTEYEAIFKVKPDRSLASLAVVPVDEPNITAALAIGSYDPEHFSVSAGTLFLDYIGNVLSRVTCRMLCA